MNDVLEKSVKLINTKLGRDKTCRIIQYFIKFLLPILQAQGPRYLDLKERLEKLASNMSMTRKVLRFGSPIPLIIGMMSRMKENEQKPVRMFFWRTVSDFMLILYYLTDHPLYFQKVGFAKFDSAFIQLLDKWNNIFWLLNSLLDLMCDIVDLYAI
mmetsp:Transcript_40374/g.29748  ORF Transcript_40374/g.29748 Transcript_40374/m.29748 type:complete len:156 (+) Transcript_40374:1-468(+)